MRARISALDPDYVVESDRAIYKNLLSLPEFIEAARVFTYISTGREPDTKALIEFCASTGKAVTIPFKYREGGIMSFALLDRPVNDLEKGKYGIPAPPDSAKELEPLPGDIMIVPALCFDAEGYRLGHGGGYYDRYLAGHGVFSAGLCREALITEKVPRERHDMRVGCVITEKKIARPE